jgi:hypothetical protein
MTVTTQAHGHVHVNSLCNQLYDSHSAHGHVHVSYLRNQPHDSHSTNTDMCMFVAYVISHMTVTAQTHGHVHVNCLHNQIYDSHSAHGHVHVLPYIINYITLRNQLHYLT